MPSVAIILTVYTEPVEEVIQQVNRIKELYPLSDIILCYDGVEPHDISGVVNVKFEVPLKRRATVGKWVESWFRAYLDNSSADYMLKLDPDTGLIKPIEFWPPGEVVFGSLIKKKTVMGNYVRWLMHGGGVGYSRSMVVKILENKWLQSSMFVNDIRFEDQEDIVTTYIFRKNGLNCIDHPEFANGIYRTPTEKASIRHP